MRPDEAVCWHKPAVGRSTHHRVSPPLLLNYCFRKMQRPSPSQPTKQPPARKKGILTVLPAVPWHIQTQTCRTNLNPWGSTKERHQCIHTNKRIFKWHVYNTAVSCCPHELFCLVVSAELLCSLWMMNHMFSLSITAAHGLVKGPKEKKQLNTEKSSDDNIYSVMFQWAVCHPHQDTVECKGPA